MRRAPVRSSSIKSLGFDPRTHVLDIEFAGGAVYRYSGVPASVYARALAAESKGRFVNAHIRERYPFKRLEPPRARN